MPKTLDLSGVFGIEPGVLGGIRTHGLSLRSSPDRALSGDTQCRKILEIQGFSAFHSPDFTAL